MGAYQRAYDEAMRDPERLWGEAARRISWSRPSDKALDDSNAPFYRWFSGGELNTCYNAVDRHVESGRADQLAVIYDSPVTGTKRRIAYRQLQDGVARCAGVLGALGVEKGDRVIIYMPMTPGGHAVALAWSMTNVYAVEPGDVFPAPGAVTGLERGARRGALRLAGP